MTTDVRSHPRRRRRAMRGSLMITKLQLSANEVLATALLRSGRLADAEDLAQSNLERAKTYGWTLAIAAQAEVCGDIALRRNNPVQAIVAWCGAAWMYVKVGRPVFEARLLQKVKAATLDVGSSNVAIQYLRLLPRRRRRFRSTASRGRGPAVRARVSVDRHALRSRGVAFGSRLSAP